eukprot:5435775-Pyramimonas_sp.AAC.1
MSRHGLQQFRKTATKHAFYSIAVGGADVPHLSDALDGTRSLDRPALLPLTDSQYMPPELLALPDGDGDH